MVDDGNIRIGSAEREEALAALAEHHAAGRLDANEYEDRRGRATDAVVRRDLTELFATCPSRVRASCRRPRRHAGRRPVAPRRGARWRAPS